MMRLQRGLLRSDAVAAAAVAGEDASDFALILGLAFAAAAGGALAGDIESGAGAGSLASAARAGGAVSDLGTTPGEACESPPVFSGAGGTIACFGAGWEAVVSVVV